MNVNITWSTDDNARIAGKKCAKKAVLDLMQTKIAILFSSVKYDINELIGGAKEELGTAPIIGCTSSKGIVVSEGYVTSTKGFAGMLALGDNETAVGTAGVEKTTTAIEAGREAARIAMNKVGTDRFPAYFMIISNPGEEEEYIQGVEEVIGNVPCFGCIASDDDLSGDWKIFTEDSIFSEGVAVAFFYTNKKMKNLMDGRYHETIHSGIITKVTEGKQLDEIDGIQALKKYCEWTDLKVKEVKGYRISKKSVLNPLMVKTDDGKMKLIKYPQNGNTDCSINLNNSVCVNTAIIQAQISKREIAEAPKYTLRDLKKQVNKDVKAFIIMHSVEKRNILDERNSKEIKQEYCSEDIVNSVREELGNVPFIMIYTYGEIGRGINTNNKCESLAISATAIYE